MTRHIVPWLCAAALALTACTKDSDTSETDPGTDGDVDTDSQGDGDSDTDPDTEQTDFAVRAQVTGLTGAGLQVTLDGGTPLDIAADGTVVLEEGFASGDAYSVVVTAQPTCPAQECLADLATGTIDDADVTLNITCGEPNVTLVVRNYQNVDPDGPPLFLLDDALSYDTSGTVTPRVHGGPNTELDTVGGTDDIAYDGVRDRLYVADGPDIHVFGSLDSLAGEAPVATFSIAGTTSVVSVCVDAVQDRLYAFGGRLWVFEDASTLSGDDLAADLELRPGGSTSLRGCDYDALNDRLYVGVSGERLAVYDDASTLVSTSMPDRMMDWDSSTGSRVVKAIEVDACTDRLYLGNNTAFGGNYLWAFDNASTQDGVIDFATDTAATVTGLPSAIGLDVDATGRLWVLPSGATAAIRLDDAASWSGLVDVSTTRVDLTGAANRANSLVTALR